MVTIKVSDVRLCGRSVIIEGDIIPLDIHPNRVSGIRPKGTRVFVRMANESQEQEVELSEKEWSTWEPRSIRSPSRRPIRFKGLRAGKLAEVLA